MGLGCVDLPSSLYYGDFFFRQAVEAVDELIDEPISGSQFLLDRQQERQAFFILLPHSLLESRIESTPQATGVPPQHFPQSLEGSVFLAFLEIGRASCRERV